MPECEVCGGDDFEELHGHFYCTVCQTQSQVIKSTNKMSTIQKIFFVLCGLKLLTFITLS